MHYSTGLKVIQPTTLSYDGSQVISGSPSMNWPMRLLIPHPRGLTPSQCTPSHRASVWTKAKSSLSGATSGPILLTPRILRSNWKLVPENASCFLMCGVPKERNSCPKQETLLLSADSLGSFPGMRPLENTISASSLKNPSAAHALHEYNRINTFWQSALSISLAFLLWLPFTVLKITLLTSLIHIWWWTYRYFWSAVVFLWNITQFDTYSRFSLVSIWSNDSSFHKDNTSSSS